MLIEQPPSLYRLLFKGALWRLRHPGRKTAYLTFDDGPVPEQTPWVLDVLDRFGVKATFFMVGDNARRYPCLVEEVLRRGHSIGNHTMHHLQGIRTDTDTYIADVAEAARHIPSRLFRPPHGILRPGQAEAVRRDYTLVMYDLVTRDYSQRLGPDDVFANVRRYARDGSIIVFHDSVKAAPNMRPALPQSIEWLLAQGFELKPLEQ